MRQRYFGVFLWLIISCGIASPSTSAQVRTRVYHAGSTPTNSVVYALPETKLYVTVRYTLIQETPGPYWSYARRYLAAKEVVSQAKTYYTLSSVLLGSYGEPSDSLQFSVEIKRNSSATNMTLTDSGILIGINAPDAAADPMPTTPAPEQNAGTTGSATSMATTYLPQAYILATSDSKRAQILAEEIYRIRESRASVLSGESDTPFPDGKAMELALNGLNDAEQQLSRYFLGIKSEVERSEIVMDIDPTKEGRQVAFRFSDTEGLLPADDLRGAPVYVEISIKEQAPELSEKESKRKEKSLRDGLIFVVPGQIHARLIDSHGRLLTEADIAVAQIGALEALESELFTNKKHRTAVWLHQSTGGIRQVSEITE